MGPRQHGCVWLGVNFTCDNTRSECVPWGRGLDLDLSESTRQPPPPLPSSRLVDRQTLKIAVTPSCTASQQTRVCVIIVRAKGNDKITRVWGPKSEKEIPFCKGLKWLLTCVFREEISKRGLLCVCACACVGVCKLTVISRLALHLEF